MAQPGSFIVAGVWVEWQALQLGNLAEKLSTGKLSRDQRVS
jgi:hypothetical protein